MAQNSDAWVGSVAGGCGIVSGLFGVGIGLFYLVSKDAGMLVIVGTAAIVLTFASLGVFSSAMKLIK